MGRRSSWGSSAASMSCRRGRRARTQRSPPERYPAGVSPADRIEAAAERSPLVRSALGQARSDHAGQVRNGSGGMPYIEHPIQVAALLDEHDYGDEVLAAALLHDVVEDSETPLDELREKFGEG